VDGVFINPKTGQMIMADLGRTQGAIDDKIAKGRIWPLLGRVDPRFDTDGAIQQRLERFIIDQKTKQNFYTNDFAMVADQTSDKLPMPGFSASHGAADRMTTAQEVQRLRNALETKERAGTLTPADAELLRGARDSIKQRNTEQATYDGLQKRIRNAVEVREAGYDATGVPNKKPPFKTGSERIDLPGGQSRDRAYIEFELKEPMNINSHRVDKVRIYEDGRMAAVEPDYGNIELGDVYTVSKNLAVRGGLKGQQEQAIMDGFNKDFRSIKQLETSQAARTAFEEAIRSGDPNKIFPDYPGLEILGDAFTKPSLAQAATNGRAAAALESVGARPEELERARTNLASVNNDPQRALLLARLEENGIVLGNKNKEVAPLDAKVREIREKNPDISVSEAIDRVVVDNVVDKQFINEVIALTGGDERQAYTILHEMKKPDTKTSRPQFYKNLQEYAHQKADLAMENDDEAGFAIWDRIWQAAAGAK
jgi:hypothetical protein